MSLTPSLELDKLPAALKLQHDKLCEETSNDKGVLKVSSQEYKITEPSVRTTVRMERIKNEMRKGVAFCGGKLSKDSVNITITPDNDKVSDVISAHFKSQVIPAMMMAPQMPVFNEVTINGKKIT